MTPDSSTTAAVDPRSSGRGAFAFVWTLWAVLLAAHFGFVATLAVNVPVWDDWEIVPTLTHNRPLTAQWLWAQHNEHRLPVPRLTLLALGWATEGDARAGMFLSVALLGALAAIFMRTAAQMRGRSAYADGFFPVALLHWAHSGNTTWSWQVGFVLSATLLGTALAFIARTGPGPRLWSALGAGLLLILLPLCGAIGVVVVPPLSIWIVVSGVVLWRSGRRRAGLAVLASAASALLVVALYLVDFHRPFRRQSAPVASLVTGLQFASIGFGWVARDGWIVHLGAGLDRIVPGAAERLVHDYWLPWALAVLIAVAVAVHSLWRARRTDSLRVVGLALFLVSMLGLALGIGIGRGALTGGGGLATRYVTLSVLVPCWAYLVAVLHGRCWSGRALTIMLPLIAALMMLRNNTLIPYQRQREVRDYLEAFQRDLRNGVPGFVLAERYSRMPRIVFPDERILAERLTMLRQAAMAQFQQLRPDPPYRVAAIAELVAGHPDPNRFILRQPRQVYAIRMRCLFDRKTAEPGGFQVTWQPDATRSEPAARSQHVTLPQEQRPQRVTFWIDEPVAAFTIEPDRNSGHAKLWDLELLLPSSPPSAPATAAN
jgi:hypothetical protein